MVWEHGPLHAQQYSLCHWCEYYIWKANFDEHLAAHIRRYVRDGPREAEAKVETPPSQLPVQDRGQGPDSTTD